MNTHLLFDPDHFFTNFHAFFLSCEPIVRILMVAGNGPISGHTFEQEAVLLH